MHHTAATMLFGAGVLLGLAADEQRASAIQSSEIDRVVHTHMSTVAQIRSIDVTIEQVAVGERDGPSRQPTTHRWRKSGPLEVYSTRAAHNDPTNRSPGMISRDEFYIDRQRAVLRSTSIADESRIAELEQGRAGGLGAKEAPLGRYMLPVGVYNYFLLRPSANALDENRTLAEFVEESLGVSLLPTESIDGHECHVIQLQHQPTYSPDITLTVMMYLDESVGGLLRQFVVQHDDYPYVCKVTRFGSFGSGTFFPLEAESFQLADNGKKFGHNRFRVTNVKINDQEEPLVWHFPEHALVSILREPISPAFTSGRGDVVLMGKEGRVARRFRADTDEFREFVEQFAVEDSRTPTVPWLKNKRTRVAALLVCGIICGAIVGWWYHYRRVAPR